jgi:hypothetical protein
MKLKKIWRRKRHHGEFHMKLKGSSTHSNNGVMTKHLKLALCFSWVNPPLICPFRCIPFSLADWQSLHVWDHSIGPNAPCLSPRVRADDCHSVSTPWVVCVSAALSTRLFIWWWGQTHSPLLCELALGTAHTKTDDTVSFYILWFPIYFYTGMN